MGHERIGILPKSKRWRAIVSEVATSDLSADSASNIARHTLDALRIHFAKLEADPSVRQAFSFLVDLATGASRPSQSDDLARKSPLAIVSDLTNVLKKTSGSLETRELVLRAAADAIATWHRENSVKQSNLFAEDDSRNSWNALSTGAGFCELSRLYFSRLTERYLNYFLDREASAVLPSISARTAFQTQLHEHIAEVSRHSFETTKIMQSYAAGWFNKHAVYSLPTEAQKNKFLSYALHKLREEFRREGQE